MILLKSSKNIREKNKYYVKRWLSYAEKLKWGNFKLNTLSIEPENISS